MDLTPAYENSYCLTYFLSKQSAKYESIRVCALLVSLFLSVTDRYYVFFISRYVVCYSIFDLSLYHDKVRLNLDCFNKYPH